MAFLIDSELIDILLVLVFVVMLVDLLGNH
jgi:hypothetical protein